MGDLRELIGGGNGNEAHPYEIGQAVFVRTVTMYYTGRITAVFRGEIVLSDAAWIPDTGRFSVALETGELAEVEPFPAAAIISRAAIIDVCEWPHLLPHEAK